MQKLGPLQEAWMRDLETTRECQGQGKLWGSEAMGSSRKGFCCLGRAALICGLSPEDIEGKGYLGDSERSRLKIISQASFSSLNDNAGLSFKRIAEMVRARPEHYFEGEA